ncbi:HD domain-containing protein [Allochromatium warmingii]|uniref:HD domain-containing protein n=1 Tax=Allochromatium warmingii TaxID=61595 RepID=A0A1H3BMN9_ALLWA|nr:HD domain-containing phosphohydrolase [Allochromatium warmingii]SDX43240.1 HD domain-containing protein [Allochromatium warmingii]
MYEDQSLDRLRTVVELIANGDYSAVSTLLEMTANSDVSPNIAALAEAFSLMLVQIEAREWHQELLIKQLLAANLEMLELLGAMVAKRDSDTSAHNYRVTMYSVRLAEAMGLDRADIRSLIKGAFLHDIGKIAIPDSILLKPNRLDEQEFAIMRTHVAHGLDIVGRSSWLKDAMDVVGYHHEKYDGSGYSTGLAGEAIPLTARVFAIVDVFDALTSLRPYKGSMRVEEALTIITESSGTHFAPEVVAAFTPLALTLYESLHQLDEPALIQAMRELVASYFEETP